MRVKEAMIWRCQQIAKQLPRIGEVFGKERSSKDFWIREACRSFALERPNILWQYGQSDVRARERRGATRPEEPRESNSDTCATDHIAAGRPIAAESRTQELRTRAIWSKRCTTQTKTLAWGRTLQLSPKAIAQNAKMMFFVSLFYQAQTVILVWFKRQTFHHWLGKPIHFRKKFSKINPFIKPLFMNGFRIRLLTI